MKREEFQFEVCANSVESCLAAREGGADRVALCAGMSGSSTAHAVWTAAREARRVSIVFFIWYVAALGQNVMVGWFSAAKLSRFCDMYLHFFVRLLYNSRKKRPEGYVFGPAGRDGGSGSVVRCRRDGWLISRE